MLTTMLVVSLLYSSARTDYSLDMTEDSDSTSTNRTEKFGEILGGQCDVRCNKQLQHVFCNNKTSLCECEPGYPVRLEETSGCAKPVNLGDQCYYYQTCLYNDQNADCIQVIHNAICQCKKGYHSVTALKPMKRIFCSQDLAYISTGFSTLFGVALGLALFTGMICFVLKLFVGARPRRYANTNLSPPIIFAQSARFLKPSLIIRHMRSTPQRVARPEMSGQAQRTKWVIKPPFPEGVGSQQSQQGTGSDDSIPITSLVGMTGVSVLRGGCTRGSRGVLVPSSRAGAARAAAILLISCHLSPSHASVHSSTSSTKSFSARQYERERENRLLAKARERERGDGGSTSPRSIENLIDGPLPSESWPQLDDIKMKAFSPDMLDDPPDVPFPDIDQLEGIDNPLGPHIDNPLGPIIDHIHIVENPVVPQDPLTMT